MPNGQSQPINNTYYNNANNVITKQIVKYIQCHTCTSSSLMPTGGYCYSAVIKML